MMTEEQIKKFSLINDKIRAEEIRARKYLIKLCDVLDLQVKNNLMDDYEYETHFSVFSYDEEFCQSRRIEVGDPFCQSNIYSLSPNDPEFFYMDWFIHGWMGFEQLKIFHFGYLMHCLIDHSGLSFEEILAIDDVWIEIIVRHQFFKDKTDLNPYKIINAE